jgi:hypothetical protein
MRTSLPTEKQKRDENAILAGAVRGILPGLAAGLVLYIILALTGMQTVLFESAEGPVVFAASLFVCTVLSVFCSFIRAFCMLP